MNTASDQTERVLLAHGGGGELTRRLLAERIVPKLSNPLLDPLADSALFETDGGSMCLTTDAFVVQPLVFPGGDIGRLAVCGTVNDLAVMGAVPRLLSLALVLDEGLPLCLLDQVVDSIAAAAREAQVVVATGDTKVIEARGSAGMTITTTGVGRLRAGLTLGMDRIRPGDAVLVTGRIAEHGLAIMAAREGLGLATDLVSDVAPLGELAERLCHSGADIKFMRDPTRSGLAGVLADITDETGLSVEVNERVIPLAPAARHLAELLGLDPLTVANEGKIVAVVAPEDAPQALAGCRDHPLGRQAALVGQVTDARPALVELLTRSGGRRLIQRPYGEELPRIC